jgi:hypothetical protein
MTGIYLEGFEDDLHFDGNGAYSQQAVDDQAQLDPSSASLLSHHASFFNPNTLNLMPRSGKRSTSSRRRGRKRGSGSRVQSRRRQDCEDEQQQQQQQFELDEDQEPGNDDDDDDNDEDSVGDDDYCNAENRASLGNARGPGRRGRNRSNSDLPWAINPSLTDGTKNIQSSSGNRKSGSSKRKSNLIIDPESTSTTHTATTTTTNRIFDSQGNLTQEMIFLNPVNQSAHGSGNRGRRRASIATESAYHHSSKFHNGPGRKRKGSLSNTAAVTRTANSPSSNLMIPPMSVNNPLSAIFPQIT